MEDRTTQQKPSAKRQSMTPEARVRIGPLLGIPRILSELGCPPEPILRRAGFDPVQFEGDPDAKISFIGASKLLDHCVTATGCRHFGLLLGQHTSCSSLGIVGFMMRFAPTVGESLHTLVRHLELHDQGGVPLINSRGDLSSLGYAIYQTGVDAADQIYDLSVAFACCIMRDLCGQQWNPYQVLLSRRPPAQQALYEQFFQAPLRFGAEQNAVLFPTQWLEHPLTSADPLLFRHLEQEAHELHIYETMSTTGKVRRLLRKSLADGKFTSPEIARDLYIHERTLHRRLREEGTCYRCELQNIRLEMARQLLAETNMPLSTIAKTLGYADTSAFVRSFKRWTGHTPVQWRSLHLLP
jgi:AraC-like DNA-binding protein